MESPAIALADRAALWALKLVVTLHALAFLGFLGVLVAAGRM